MLPEIAKFQVRTYPQLVNLRYFVKDCHTTIEVISLILIQVYKGAKFLDSVKYFTEDSFLIKK